ncbi:MAG: hypothetical protein CMJ85_09045 [Planctomycetes bacterium]|nr:hypothetical protein [Planctomycetota bacterium]
MGIFDAYNLGMLRHAVLARCTLAALAVVVSNAQAQLDRLRTQLADENPRTRRQAVAAAARLGKRAEPLIPQLIALLADSDRGVSCDAVECCVDLGPAVEKPLRAALPNMLGTASVYAASICARLDIVLAADESRRLDSALVPALGAKDAAIRLAAAHGARAIAEPGDTLVVRLLAAIDDAAANVRGAADLSVHHIALRALPRMRAVLATGKVKGTPRLVRALAQLQGSPVFLARFCKDNDAATRLAAVVQLGRARWRARRQLPAIETALEDKDKEVRAAAVRAFGQVTGDREAFTATLAKAVRSKHAATRHAAYRCLADGCPMLPSFLPYIVPDLANEKLREAAIEALVRARHRAPALLRPLLASGPAAARAAAGLALARCRDANSDDIAHILALLDDKDGNVRATAMRAVAQLGRRARDAVPSLVQLLKRKKDSAAAADALATMGSSARRAVTPLIKLLKSKDPELRRAAATALGALSAKKAIPRLARMLKEPYTGAFAAQALGAFADKAKTSLPQLVAALRDKKGPHRDQVAWAMGLIAEALQWSTGWSATPVRAVRSVQAALRAAANSDAPGLVRRWAVNALVRATRKESAECVAALRVWAKDPDESVREQALESLAKFTVGRAATAKLLVTELAAGSPGVRAAALAGLRRLGEPWTRLALDTLQPLLADPDRSLHEAVARVIGGVRNDGTRILLQGLEHESAIVRRASLAGLADSRYVLAKDRIQMLLALVADADSGSRKRIAQLVTRSPGGVDALRGAATSEKVVLRRLAAQAAAMLSANHKSVLEALLTDEDELVRTRAEDGLRK